MIQVEGLVKKYGGHTAVDQLTFTVEKGQIYGFLGPNGAGKSTTMNIMTGYIAANGGTVVINGHDILKEPEKAKKCIGYLPEIPPLYTDMTVWEYLLFVAELKKVRKKERVRHVEEIMEKIQLADTKDRLIKNLSKGYRQRVGLAQALVGDPEVVILDEPMVGLDPKQIIEMRDLIKSLSKDHTVILSSHILSEVSAVCDHIMIISKGKLAASGSPEELQEMMHVKVEFEVTVLGTAGQVVETLQNIERIASYSIDPAEDEDSVRIRVEAIENADIRKELSVALSGAGLPILSINRIEKSLEDIFLELTGSEEERPDTFTDGGMEEDEVENTEPDQKINEENIGESELKTDSDGNGPEIKGKEEADDGSNL